MNITGIGSASPQAVPPGPSPARPSADLMRAELEAKRGRIIGDVVDISIERMAEARERREAEAEAERLEERRVRLDQLELDAQADAARRRAELERSIASGRDA